MPPNSDHQQVAGQLDAIAQEFRQIQEFQFRLKQNGLDIDSMVAGGAPLNDDTETRSFDSDHSYQCSPLLVPGSLPYDGASDSDSMHSEDPGL